MAIEKQSQTEGAHSYVNLNSERSFNDGSETVSSEKDAI